MKGWRRIYGALFALAAVTVAVTFMLNAPSIVTTAVGQFDLGWTLWSWSQMQFGVIPYVGL
jgi:hypothetical protein